MKKLTLTIITALALCVLLIGCAEKSSTIEVGENVYTYNLGEGTLSTAAGDIPYQMQGVIGVPDAENAPVVVIIHGAHPITTASEDRYDTGFTYLVEDLSRAGNLVLSLNVGINYSFENGEPNGNERTKQIVAQHISELKKAIDGEKTAFGLDLKSKGSLDNVVLLGHSRGGMDVFEIASETQDFNVAGVLSIAPSYDRELSSPLPKVPIGIIIPQYDGDVVRLDGSDFYERLLAQEGGAKDAELIYLKGANHGAFNTQITKKDPSTTDEIEKKLMPAEEQRSFLSSYAADFIQSVQASGETPFGKAAELPTQLYGHEVLLRAHAASSKLLFSAEAPPVTAPQEVKTQQLIASKVPDKNTVGTFNMPGSVELNEYALTNVIWEQKGAELEIPINADLLGKAYLDFDMAMDSTDPRNAMKNQNMSIRFTDSTGAKKEITICDYAAPMQWQEGKLENLGTEGEPLYMYSTFTPLTTLRIDLKKLDGIDLSKLKTIALVFDQTDAGSIMLRSISAS
ncbi:MAG: hypothetical protein RSA62_04200 [Oscillospiraceae bacterium]